MITKITSTQELKQMFLEIFLNKTDKVNDISEESVLNGIAYGSAKIGQKCLTNQAIIEGHFFPETAYGSYLDEAAKRRGVSERFGACGSSVYIRLIGVPGTFYSKDVCKFTSTDGINFSLESDVTIGTLGYIYAKAKSDGVGLNTQVNPLSINKLSSIPTGHIACTNEYQATGGRDEEDDELYRVRIKESLNQLARPTLSYLEQVFMKINPNVLKLKKGGIDSDGKFNLIVIPVNGVDFTDDEFNQILLKSEKFLTLNELMNNTSGYSLKLKNVDWLMVDIEFRVDIDPAYNQDKVRREIQIQMNKLFDYRFWKEGDKVEWENLFFVSRTPDGVRYVPDTHFNPRVDINVPDYRLPRVRGFVLRDLDGNIIEDNNGVLNSFNYPNEPDVVFANSVLTSI